MQPRWPGVVAVLCCVLNGAPQAGEPATPTPAAQPKPQDKAPEKASPKDPFDALKNIPLGGAVFSFSLNERLRCERWNNEDLDDAKHDRDRRLFVRTRLRMDTTFADWLATCVEVVDNREWLSDRNPRPQNDDLDLHQAYVQLDLKKRLGQPLMVRLGRQELDFGSRKLVAAPTWNNLLRSFDAGRVSYTSDLVDLHAFCGSVVTPVDDQFNDHRHDESLSGLFATLKPVKNQKLDLYALRLHTWNDEFFVTGEDKVKGEHKLYTFGARVYGDLIPKRWTYDVEAALQRGHYANDDIRAWAFHADTAYTLLDLPWQPTLQPVFNYASGDKNPTDGVRNTFDPLYCSVHNMFGGIMDQVTWMNVKVVGLRVRAKPTTKLAIGVEAHRYWLAEDEDAWYPGNKKAKRRDKTGASGGDLGCEIGAWALYTVNKHLELEAGVARFFAGSFVDRTGPSDTMEFCYLMTTFKF